MDGGIGEVDEARNHFTVTANLIQLARIPQGHDGAHELDKVLLPFPVWRRTATCISVSVKCHSSKRAGRYDVRVSVS